MKPMVHFLNATAESNAISIIGGADGPTAIFVSSKISPTLFVALVAAGVLVLAGIVWWVIQWFRHKK